MDLKILQVKISDREKTIFEGDAIAISSNNDIGPFDILGGHANFVTSIKEYVVVHKNNSVKTKFDIEKGILRVKENILEVFVGV